MEPQFSVVTDASEWPPIDVVYSLRKNAFVAQMHLMMPDPIDVSRTGWLRFTSEGDTPDEAQARLEQAVVETLAQGGQLVERRSSSPGRRAYDAMESSHTFNTCWWMGRREKDRL